MTRQPCGLKKVRGKKTKQETAGLEGKKEGGIGQLVDERRGRSRRADERRGRRTRCKRNMRKCGNMFDLGSTVETGRVVLYVWIKFVG